MAPCTFNHLIDAYHDGELPAARRAEIESHIASCAACSQALADLRSLSAGFGGLNRPVMPADFLTQLRAQADLHADAAARDAMRIDPLSDRGVLRLVRTLSALAASVLVTATVGVFVASTSTSSGTSASTSASTISPSGWEQTAVSLQAADGATAAAGNTPPSIETAEWIVAGLSANGKN